MTVLIVDDEERIRTLIKEYCLNENYDVLESSDGKEALDTIKNSKVDIVILDIMMPNMDGLTAYNEIKKYNIPTIILSARSEEYDKLIGFDLGVDDYVTKPFSPKELIARIKAVTKRFNDLTDSYIYKNLRVDFKGHVVYIKDKEIKLTPKEYDLLVYFINNKNVALSREELLSKIWGYDFYGDDRTIDTHIKMLRNNLGEYRDLIQTVRGMGYKFEIK
ncbi:MAG TPA: response regulator transcription factor [Candidatus Faecisoma merdavium]|nr:response regulator transcription factor [Candidatus Faecisoma merdavium]